MSSLKIKIQIGNALVELEGSSEDVKSSLEYIKSDILSSTVVRILPTEESRIDMTVGIVNSLNDLPSLKELQVKNQISSHAEWILIFAYYKYIETDQYDMSTADIKEKYNEIQIFDISAQKNFSKNLKANILNNLIKILANGQLQITEDGINKAKEIINKERKSNEKKTTGKNIKSKTVIQSSKSPTLISTVPNTTDKKSLKDLYSEFKSPNGVQKIAIFVHYLIDYVKLDEKVTIDHIYTCFRLLNLEVSKFLYQVIINAKNRPYELIQDDKTTGLKLTIIGENYINKAK